MAVKFSKVEDEEQKMGKAAELKAKISMEIERIRGMEARERAKQEEREKKKNMEEEAKSTEGSTVESETRLGEGPLEKGHEEHHENLQFVKKIKVTRDENVPGIKCEHCPDLTYRFVTAFDLNKHMEAMHGEEQVGDLF